MPIRTDSGIKLTWEDYLQFPDDGGRHEIVDGVHLVNPAPTPRHQIASREIQFQLHAWLKQTNAGEVFDAPIDVRLSDTDVVQPDLVVITRQNAAIVTETKIERRARPRHRDPFAVDGSHRSRGQEDRIRATRRPRVLDRRRGEAGRRAARARRRPLPPSRRGDGQDHERRAAGADGRAHADLVMCPGLSVARCPGLRRTHPASHSSRRGLSRRAHTTW